MIICTNKVKRWHKKQKKINAVSRWQKVSCKKEIKLINKYLVPKSKAIVKLKFDSDVLSCR